MTHISIRERPAGTNGDMNAVLIFDHGEEYPITVSDPFTKVEEERLEWYFEQHLRFPFTQQVRAREAAESVAAYGEALFKQVFADARSYTRYKKATQTGVGVLAVEISGSPGFHALHWEALKDPDLPQPMALQVPIVRRNLVPQTVRARVRPSPTLNLLVVSARPGGAKDVGYRTISRPLVEGLRQAGVPVRVEILRPGTYRALADHLEAFQEAYGSGHYHVIHFDVHGALLEYRQLEQGYQPDRYVYAALYSRADIEPYEGQKAFLYLEGDKEGQVDLVEARELADLLVGHQIPIVVLSACQSGKQVRAEANNAPLEVRETSLGSRLMSAGVQMVLAMSYSVTVSAARLLMTTLYEQLFAGQELPAAIRRARLELFNDKSRRAYFNQTIDLEDWLLPVVYQNQEQRLQRRDFTDQERAAYYERQARRYRAPEVSYGFLGRDLDILQIERRLLTRRNLLLVRGMGGAGKTTLLHHLASWWQSTGFVERVCYFGYDERAWNRQQIMAAVARELMSEAEYTTTFQPLSPPAQQALLAERLCAEPHLLILDNLESITGTHLAVKNTLPKQERERLHEFLSELAGGRTLVLLGSRGGEQWLALATFEENVYDLPGLDPEAASTLADRVLARHDATRYRQHADVQRLLDLLDGYPLPLEVVLANLARQTPAQVLAALQAGDAAIDMRGKSKTESILRCIDYSHSNLSPDAQGLLACLAPFTSVLWKDQLERYSTQLRQQPALAHLSFESWPEVLQEAADWGLLSPHPQIPVFLRLQPILPYFLRSRLAAPPVSPPPAATEGAGLRQAIETAFRRHYDDLGGAIAGLLKSREAQEKQRGQMLAHLEYENLVTALNLALENRAPFFNVYSPLYEYLLLMQDGPRRLDLCQMVMEQQDHYTSQQLSGEIGVHFYLVLARLARTHQELKAYETSKENYERALEIAQSLDSLPEKTRANYVAIMYHQLGIVAQKQRQWAQAKDYYQQALEIYIEFNDRYSQAKTYHQLGMVAQEQRQWAQAQDYYQQAMEIKIEFNDRYSQASTTQQLGIVAQEQRQWAQAQDYYQQAMEIYIEFNDRYAQAKTYHNLGAVAQAQRQWAQAQDYYQQALEIYIEFNDRYAQASTYHQLGMVAQAQRQWAQAQDYYRQTLEIYIKFNDRYAQADTYHNLGVVAQAQRQWAQAQATYQQAMEIYIEFNDRYSQASTYGQLGLLAEAQEQWKQAQQYLLQALEIFRDAGDEHYREITLRNLARLWQASEDAGLPAAVAALLQISPQQAEERLRAAL